MKHIITMSSAFMMALASMGISQTTPAATPAVPQAPSVKTPEGEKVSEMDVLAILQEMGDILTTVKDKASADAAAEKVAKNIAKQFAYASAAQGKPVDMSEENKMKMMNVGMKAAMEGQRIMQANCYGSDALKKAMTPPIPAGTPAPPAPNSAPSPAPAPAAN